jgi:hypothetical protein
MLRAFLGIKDKIEAILARNGITSKQRVIFEDFRAIADKNKWGLRHSQRIAFMIYW